jgi:hypothetical protein
MNISRSPSAALRSGSRKPHEPKVPNASKFRATEPRIERADVHICLASDAREAAGE